ncbi:hypothetical protein TNCT_542171, partial [Trichonephila clavata]
MFSIDILDQGDNGIICPKHSTDK